MVNAFHAACNGFRLDVCVFCAACNGFCLPCSDFCLDVSVFRAACNGFRLDIFGLIPIRYEDAPNYMRNEPQRTHRHEVASRRVGHKERKKERKKKPRSFGAASQRNGISLARIKRHRISVQCFPVLQCSQSRFFVSDRLTFKTVATIILRVCVRQIHTLYSAKSHFIYYSFIHFPRLFSAYTVQSGMS